MPTTSRRRGRGVRQLLAPFPDFTVVGECRDGAEVLAALDTLNPHVVFLDIQMPGIDGFEVIRRRTPDRMPIVVFLTAYDEFAIRAFDAQALDYLVKPVSEARFAATMKRLVRQLKTASPASREPAWSSRRRAARRSCLYATSTGSNRPTTTRVSGPASSYLLREPLRTLEQRVGERGFVRAHRRALIRLDGVRELTWNKNGDLVAVLASGARIPVSRRRRAAFSAAVKAHSRGRG